MSTPFSIKRRKSPSVKMPSTRCASSTMAEAPNPLRLELHLIYLNTSSVRAMIDILDLLEAAHGRGRAVSVQWYYDHRNQRVAELAEEFKEDYTFAFDTLTLSP